MPPIIRTRSRRHLGAGAVAPHEGEKSRHGGGNRYHLRPNAPDAKRWCREAMGLPDTHAPIRIFGGEILILINR